MVHTISPEGTAMQEELSAEESIIASLRRIIRAVDLHSRYLAQRYGLTGPQFVLLRELARNQPLSTGELAQRVSLGQATVSQILDRLGKRELVKRNRSDVDKRRVMNEITDKGREAIKTSPSLMQERFTTELKKLADWERTLILSTLQRVASMMQAEELTASPVLLTGPLDATEQETAEFLEGEEDSES
jgi:DNA-binding MarR family transcriptional regulator